ncbi:hypothetical protein DICVIV_03421 [Dictyocaulus viviparus]|uniref:Polycystin cation channel PKD1/PKD2 domain-containing protein n=1 Tax=Dictyocaulus viviparus TaxID=29172 RepID=A0A0D8Y143_DICVI|nr:hypothetical protein DICVIV_03421 [Dictyocaulus viviparus]
MPRIFSQSYIHFTCLRPRDQQSVDFQKVLEELNDHDRDTGERLRRHLQFFFMSPLEKWKIRRQFPYKLALQVLKIVFVTLQLILFAEMRMSHVDFMEDTNTVMRHKFLKDWNDDRDALQYPPAEGRYSVYDGKGIVEHLAFIINAYYSLQTDSFASFSYDIQTPPKYFNVRNDRSLESDHEFKNIPYLLLCVDRINNVTVNNNTYEFDITEVHECMHLNLTAIEVKEVIENSTAVGSVLGKRGITFTPEDALIIAKLSLEFKLRTIHFSPKSVLLAESIILKFAFFSGVGLAIDTLIMGFVDIIVLFLCLFSLILCFRALIKAQLLKIKTVDFFESMFRTKISVSDQLDFLNLWYVMIVINDLLIIVGTVSKISIEFRDFDNSVFTLTGILLGMGALLVYVGVLRYFGFFNQYNVLILTMKKSIPNVARFMTCVIVLYVGFLIAGWVIIGPYSMKDYFENISLVQVFGTIYIYCFVSVFIYVVLSLFIAIIMDAYEVVKDRYSFGLSEEHSALKEFMDTAPFLELNSPTAQAQFAPQALLNLGRFGSFSNPLDNTSNPAVNDEVVLSIQRA